MPRSVVKDWVLSHQLLLGGISVGVHVLLILVDLFLVLHIGGDSISLRVWLATQAHPTIIDAGIIGTVATCALVRRVWWLVAFQAFMGGHLFAHW